MREKEFAKAINLVKSMFSDDDDMFTDIFAKDNYGFIRAELFEVDMIKHKNAILQLSRLAHEFIICGYISDDEDISESVVINISVKDVSFKENPPELHKVRGNTPIDTSYFGFLEILGITAQAAEGELKEREPVQVFNPYIAREFKEYYDLLEELNFKGYNGTIEGKIDPESGRGNILLVIDRINVKKDITLIREILNKFKILKLSSNINGELHLYTYVDDVFTTIGYNNPQGKPKVET